MRRPLARFAFAVRRLMRISALTGMMLVTAVALIVVYDVISRKLLAKPIFGVPELTEMSMLFVCFLSIGYIAHRKQEINIDIMNVRLPGWMAETLRATRLLLCLFVLGLIVWQSLTQGLHVMRTGEITTSLRMPVWPFYFVITYGSVHIGDRIFRLKTIEPYISGRRTR